MRKFIIRTATAVSLASALLMLPGGWESAETKQVKSACEVRYDGCVKRCVERYFDPKNPQGASQEMNCMVRTCDKQRANCNAAANPKAPRPSGGVHKGGTWHGATTQQAPRPSGDVSKGGTWHGPASPPKAAGGTSVPTGGVWRQSPGGSGPILKSGGKR